MKKLKIFFVAILAVASLYSCSDEDATMGGEGRVSLRTTVNSDVKVLSRAATEQELADGCNVWISSTKGLVRKYQGLSNVPAEIWLTSGDYVAEAWAGDSVAASFDSKYFKGYQPFTVSAGGSVTVNLVCKIANVVVSVNYSESVDEVLSDYTMTVEHTKGSLSFVGRDNRKGYFMMPNGVSSLTWSLTGTKVDGSEYVRTGTIENVKSATEYKLNVSHNGTDASLGGGLLTVVVDETEVEVEDEVIITAAPSIQGVDFDITEPLYCEVGKVGRRSVYVSAATSLKSVVMSCDKASELGIPAAIDWMTMDGTAREELEALGLTSKYEYDAENDLSNLKINMEEVLTNALPEAEYLFTFVAVDNFDKQRTVAFTLSVSNAAVVADDIVQSTVWATTAVLTGTKLKDDATDLGFNYRERGASEWTSVAVDASASNFSVSLSGLKPGTTYEYVATSTDFVSAIVKTFTTETAAQVPNSGFEDWDTSSKAYLLCASGDSMFWDSGNHGSSTMNKNITTPESEIKHSGNYSAKLQSQFVGFGSLGKFAAGNAFVGDYLDTDGTDGILGFGRPFTSRPSALKGYVKYTPGQIAYTNSELPDVTENDMDKGAIYIAIMDNTTESYDGTYWPFVIKTKASSRRLFDKTDARVLGYGEMIFTEATAGDGLIEFNIPIEYSRTDVSASNILIVCSSSYYGDYFVGGSSVMYIDDFELIYE